MNQEQRDGLLRFCLIATHDITGNDILDIDIAQFAELSDEDLEAKAKELDDRLTRQSFAPNHPTRNEELT